MKEKNSNGKLQFFISKTWISGQIQSNLTEMYHHTMYNVCYIVHRNRKFVRGKKYGCLTIDRALVTVKSTIITHYSYASVHFVSFFSLDVSALHHSVAISVISLFLFRFDYLDEFFPPITFLSFILRFSHCFLHITFIVWRMYEILFNLPYCIVHIDYDSR